MRIAQGHFELEPHDAALICVHEAWMGSRLGMRVAVVVCAIALPVSGRRILVSSYGGSGSTDVMKALRAAGFGTNSLKNAEHLKHSTASATTHRLRAQDGKLCWRNDKDKCFDRVLVVERDDPAKAIVSTVARFGLGHYRRISKGCQACPSPKTLSGGPDFQVLRRVFDASGRAGGDVYGLSSHFTSWERIDGNPKWPPVLFADATTLSSPRFACALFGFLDLKDLKLRKAFAARMTKNHPSSKRIDPITLMQNDSRRVYAKLGDRIRTRIRASTARVNASFCEGAAPRPPSPGPKSGPGRR